MERSFELPHNYGDNKIVLMVRDPWTIYTYWETCQKIENEIRDKIRDKGLTAQKSILRVYDVTDPEAEPKTIFDFELRDWISSWYIHAPESGKTWMVDVGVICTNGEFFTLARSNTVKTPTGHISNIYDEEWMCTEELYKKALGIGDSSLTFTEAVESHLQKWLSSGGISAGIFKTKPNTVKKK